MRRLEVLSGGGERPEPESTMVDEVSVMWEGGLHPKGPIKVVEKRDVAPPSWVSISNSSLELAISCCCCCAAAATWLSSSIISSSKVTSCQLLLLLLRQLLLLEMEVERLRHPHCHHHHVCLCRTINWHQQLKIRWSSAATVVAVLIARDEVVVILCEMVDLFYVQQWYLCPGYLLENVCQIWRSGIYV